jgi:Flp pilus assembly protein TadD
MKAKLGPNHGITLGAMNGLADSYHAVDRHADALKLREDTLALRKAKRGADDPETLAAMDSLARHLANWPDPKLRNANRALELAKELVAAAPQLGHFWNTLGVAHYRNGDYKAAVAALKKSMELRQGGDSFDWFFLAMAHWQLGDKDQARKWYDQAVNAMDKNPWDRNRPQFDTLRRFRAEAEELMKSDPGIRSPRRCAQ